MRLELKIDDSVREKQGGEGYGENEGVDEGKVRDRARVSWWLGCFQLKKRNV